MPTTPEILAGLATIASDAVVLAIMWHVVVLAAIVFLAIGWRPNRRVAVSLLAAPIASAAILAFAHGNPFNGALLGAATLTFAALAVRADGRPVDDGPRWAMLVAGAMIGFAWVYPHFLTGAWITYLFAAPMGLVPCPTLALAIGFALLAGGIDRAVAGVLAGLGILYGAIGVFRLGIGLDVGLLVGATAMLAIAARPAHPPIRQLELAHHRLS